VGEDHFESCAAWTKNATAPSGTAVYTRKVNIIHLMIRDPCFALLLSLCFLVSRPGFIFQCVVKQPQHSVGQLVETATINANTNAPIKFKGEFFVDGIELTVEVRFILPLLMRGFSLILSLLDKVLDSWNRAFTGRRPNSQILPVEELLMQSGCE